MSYSILLFEVEGENRVPKILVGKSLGYETIDSDELDYWDESTYFGFLKGRKISFAEYERECQKKEEMRVEKVHEDYKKAISKDYFDATADLAREYAETSDLYEKFCKETTKRNKAFYKNPIYRNRHDFVQRHPEIDNPLDIRFNNFYYEELIDDPKRPNVKMVSHFYDANPKVDYETYREFIEFSFPKLLERTRENPESDVEAVRHEFQTIFRQIKALLEKHGKVGLAFLEHDGQPMRYLEREFKKIDDFTIDDFVTFSYRIVYWFRK